MRELWASHRQNKRNDFGWEKRINLGCATGRSIGINLANAGNAGPTLFEDESGSLFLYFTRSLTPNNPTIADIYFSACSADLTTCDMQGLWDKGKIVPALSSPHRDTRMAIRRRDGLEIILSSGRTGSLGNENLWVSTRAVALD